MTAVIRAAVLLSVVTLGCSGPVEERVARCPAGHTEDAPRAARIAARLASVAEGRALGRHLEGHVLCFAPDGLGVISEERQLLLSEALGDGENAARVGHLLVHARDGLPLEYGSVTDCDARVARALDREALAHVVEVRLQVALGVTPRHFAFEFAAEVMAADDDASAVALVRRYLNEHPTGAPGIDGLSAAYHQRCAAGG